MFNYREILHGNKSYPRIVSPVQLCDSPSLKFFHLHRALVDFNYYSVNTCLTRIPIGTRTFQFIVIFYLAGFLKNFFTTHARPRATLHPPDMRVCITISRFPASNVLSGMSAALNNIKL